MGGHSPARIHAGGQESLQLDLRTGKTASFAINVVDLRVPVFSQDGQLLAVPSVRGFVRLLQAASFREIATLSGYMFGVHSVGFSPDLHRLAAGSTAFEAMTVWDLASYQRLITLEAKVGQLYGTSFSPDGNVIAGHALIGETAGTLFFWRAPSWAEIEAAERKDAGKASESVNVRGNITDKSARLKTL